MKSIDTRLSKLEDRLGITRSATRYLLILMDGGREFRPADEVYIKSLHEAGVLPTVGFGVVDLSNVAVGHETRRALVAPPAELTDRTVDSVRRGRVLNVIDDRPINGHLPVSH